MRIRGQSTGGFSGGGRESGSEREVFRRGHRVGDRVRGRILGPAGHGLTLVQAGGHRLTAGIADPPPPGTVLDFLVTGLDPDIVLKVIHPAAASGMSPADLLGSIATLAARLESLPLTAKAATAATLPERYRDFILLARRSPETAGLLRELSRLHALVDRLLSRGLPPGSGMIGATGRLRYRRTPWLLPGARSQELLIRKDSDRGFVEIILGFTLDLLGRAEVRLLSRPDDAGYRLLAERTEHAGAIGERIEAEFRHLAPSGAVARCLGSFPLPRPEAIGVLARLLGPPPGLQRSV